MRIRGSGGGEGVRVSMWRHVAPTPRLGGNGEAVSTLQCRLHCTVLQGGLLPPCVASSVLQSAYKLLIMSLPPPCRNRPHFTVHRPLLRHTEMEHFERGMFLYFLQENWLSVAP